MISGSDNRNPFSEIIVYIGLIFLCIICFLAIALFNSCCSPKVIEKIETKIEVRDSIVHDTAYYEIPKEVYVNVTSDTISNLETSVARSTAYISDGLLHHSLENKNQSIALPIQIHVTITNTKQISAKEVDRPVIQKVEKKLTWWQRVRLDTYYILLALIAVYCLIKYRKGLWSLIKSIL